MRKIFCLIMVCILASVFVSVSNASALGKNKILYTQWLVSGIMKVYLPTGEFLGAAAGGSGIMSIDGDMLVTGTYAITFDTTLDDPLVLGARSDFTLSETTYNATTSLLKGTYCVVNILYPEGGPDPFIYEGDCNTKITFTSATAFIGQTSFTTDPVAGVTVVIEMSGKLLGKVLPQPSL